jgi:hypothetical protein
MSLAKRITPVATFLLFVFFLLPVLLQRLMPRDRAGQGKATHVFKSLDDIDDMEGMSNREQEEAIRKMSAEELRLLDTAQSPTSISVDEARELARRRGHLFPEGMEKSIQQATRWRGSLGLTIESGAARYEVVQYPRSMLFDIPDHLIRQKRRFRDYTVLDIRDPAFTPPVQSVQYVSVNSKARLLVTNPITFSDPNMDTIIATFKSLPRQGTKPAPSDQTSR